MNVWLKLALKELWNKKGFSFFFILNMSLGLTGFVAVNTFKGSIVSYLENNLKSVLAADVTVSSREPFTDEQLKFVSEFFGEGYERSEGMDFFSMVSGEKNSRLVQVVVIDEKFPLYGSISLQSAGKADGDFITRELRETKNIWLNPDTLSMLGMEVGESLKLGESRFTVSDLVTEEPSSAFGFSGMAGTVYVGLEQLEDAGLFGKGTRTNHMIYLKNEGIEDVDELKQAFYETAEARLGEGSGLRFRSFKDSSDRVGGLLSRVVGYLNVIATIALFMAGCGAAYLFRDYFHSRLSGVALLNSLGASKNRSYSIVLLQILALGVFASLFTLFFVSLLLPFMPLLLREVVTAEFDFAISSQTALTTFLIGSLTCLAFCFPVMVKYRGLRPLQIFKEKGADWSGRKGDFALYLSYLPILLIFWGIVAGQSGIRDGSLFLLILLAAVGLIGCMAYLLILAGEKFSAKSGVNLKIALRNVSRHKFSTVASFTAIALGTFLVSIVPQIYQGLYDEIRRPDGVRIPALFLFDIQEDQLEGLEVLTEAEKTSLNNVSPMIRARLAEVNGMPVAEFMSERNAEEGERGPFSRERRVFNITYRDGLGESETLDRGTSFREYAENREDDLQMISIDHRFADRFGIEIGDELAFNIQGVDIVGRVVNFRKVKWNSFQPNFFIVFEPGELVHAPKIFLANVPESKNLDKTDFQDKVVENFPNVSVINVSQILLKLLGIAEKMIFAVTAMAYLSILAGLAVIYSIARSEAKNRKWEINMLKVLGARFGDVRKILLYEFGLTGVIAALFGMGLSILFSAALSRLLLSGVWAGSWFLNALTLVSISSVIVVTTQVAAAKIISQKPWRLLRED